MTLNRKQFANGVLPMFMTADELADPDSVIHADRLFGDEPMDRFVGEKLERAKKRSGHPWRPDEPEYDEDMGTSLYDSIEKHGVREPVKMDVPGTPQPFFISERPDYDPGKPLLTNGHHRVFAAADVQRRTGKDKWVPVEWHDENEEL